MRVIPFICAVLVAGLALGAEKKEPTAGEVAKMQAAAPERARVAAERPRKVLIFSVSWGYWHDSIPYGKRVFEILGKKTGAFETVASDDPAMFEPQKLRQFDAVIFNNANNEIFLPEDFDKLSTGEKAKAAARDEMLKKSFVEWLSSGKGLVVIHAGVASFRKWPEYGNIVGARFDNHPWGSGSTVTLKVDEPNHPLAAAFTSPTFAIRDEIYQMTGPYSREKLRVILSIDTAKTNMKRAGVHRTDGDFAMSWIKMYGKGRVFYNALGHDHDIFWNPVVLQHWLDGIQFATGDLKADATPSDKAGK